MDVNTVLFFCWSRCCFARCSPCEQVQTETSTPLPSSNWGSDWVWIRMEEQNWNAPRQSWNFKRTPGIASVAISEDRVSTNLLAYCHFPTTNHLYIHLSTLHPTIEQFWGSDPSIIASNKRPAVLPTGDRQKKHGADEGCLSCDSKCDIAEFGDTWK